MIVPIGRWVMLEACRQAQEWQKQFVTDVSLMVSVNLSGKHLQQATLIDEVQDVLKITGIDPQHLIIEITETVAMAGAETTIEILTKLKSLGVLLAIDDFGTGFSSLAYLKRFPVDLLKIDKSFVDGVAHQRPRHGDRRGDHRARARARPAGHRRGRRTRPNSCSSCARSGRSWDRATSSASRCPATAAGHAVAAAGASALGGRTKQRVR